MSKRPFRKLKQPRYVERHQIPEALADFYELHEGSGLESAPTDDVRLCRLDEIALCEPMDVPMLQHNKLNPEWDQFAGWFVGIGMFHDRIYLVEQAPCCEAGSILALGPDVAGPGGHGESLMEPSLVLAASFSQWLDHLQQCEWEEFGLRPGSIDDLPADRAREVRSYYTALNPHISWRNSAGR